MHSRLLQTWLLRAHSAFCPSLLFGPSACTTSRRTSHALSHARLLCHVTTTTTPTSTLTSSACLEVICISYGTAITRCRSSAPFGASLVSYVECGRVFSSSLHVTNEVTLEAAQYTIISCVLSAVFRETDHGVLVTTGS